MKYEKFEETKEEKEILKEINRALRKMEKDEEENFRYLKPPEYHRPAYKFWWVLGPIGTIVIALIILSIIPNNSSNANRVDLDSQIIAIYDELDLVDVETEKKFPALEEIDNQIQDVEKTTNLLKEEKNG
jgi:hypothetical protein